MNKISYKLIG